MVLGIRPNTKFVYSLKGTLRGSFFALHIEEAPVARPLIMLSYIFQG